MAIKYITSSIILIGLLALTSLSGCSSGVSLTEFENLQTDYDSVCADLEDVQSTLASTQTLQESTEDSLETMETLHDLLVASYSLLQAEHNLLEANYNLLDTTYNDLSTEYSTVETLRIGHLLSDYYTLIRQDVSDDNEGFFGWLAGGFTREERVDFYASLARHGLGLNYPTDRNDRYYDLAGEFSHVTARNALDNVIELIGIEDSDSTVEKIEKILAFINTYIHYERDFDNAMLAPMETLGYRSGDCEDFSILAAALFETVGIDTAIASFDGESSAHAMILLHNIDSIAPYNGYYYSDITSLGLQSGEWLIIEPQQTIENQHTDWILEWTIKVAAEV